jgi:hypothetical protein
MRARPTRYPRRMRVSCCERYHGETAGDTDIMSALIGPQDAGRATYLTKGMQ